MGKRAILLTTLAFAVTGPLIGGLLAFLWALLSSAAAGHALTVRDFTITGPAVLSWAYLLGWAPAAATGFSWSLLSRYLTRNATLRPLGRSAWGALLGAVFGAAAGLFWDAMSWGGARLVAVCLPCGLLAGAILCLALPRQDLTPWPSNNRWRGP